MISCGHAVSSLTNNLNIGTAQICKYDTLVLSYSKLICHSNYCFILKFSEAAYEFPNKFLLK